MQHQASARATQATVAPRRWQGAKLVDSGTAHFEMWAPGCDHVSLAILGEPGALPMPRTDDGWFELSAPAHPGTLYQFVLPDGMHVPDAASRFQPAGVHGPSELIVRPPPAKNKRIGRPWSESIIYELHTGTFTPEGTFRAAIGKLDHLVDLGVTSLELMPVAAFPGARNWGYDGVHPFAPAASYGRPEDLQALIDAAHERNLSVLLDVVYNHFGPEGNYLPVYAPAFFTKRHKTPWGSAVNFDGVQSRAVRDFFIANVLFWLDEYRLDGLRLDAVHTIIDDSPIHILAEIAERVRVAYPHGEKHLILENERNHAFRLERDFRGRPRTFTAQWNDDVHHVLHTAITQESEGYYRNYAGDTDKLGRAIAQGFADQGEARQQPEKPRGEPSGHLPPVAFISFLQNHDQIGNRAFGDRIGASTPAGAVRAAAAVYLLAPQIPMLFMGEEWGASSAFPFFSDFGPDLADAVRNGRRAEFAHFSQFRDPELREQIPDPQSEHTFAAAKLRWDELRQTPHRDQLDWYRRILHCRRKSIVPLLRHIESGGHYQVVAPCAIAAEWSVGHRERLILNANLSAAPVAGFTTPERVIWEEGGGRLDNGNLAPWSVLWGLSKQE